MIAEDLQKIADAIVSVEDDTNSIIGCELTVEGKTYVFDGEKFIRSLENELAENLV